MNDRHFDVVVVGARVAGAALAMFLARSGRRVLLVDKNPLPSDQILSTHTIYPPGIDVLDELGVGAQVREVAPAIRRIRLRKGNTWADLSFENGRAAYCPRRERLDGLLPLSAVAPCLLGAMLRGRFAVLGEFLAHGRRMAEYRKVLNDRTRLLDAVDVN